MIFETSPSQSKTCEHQGAATAKRSMNGGRWRAEQPGGSYGYGDLAMGGCEILHQLMVIPKSYYLLCFSRMSKTEMCFSDVLRIPKKIEVPSSSDLKYKSQHVPRDFPMKLPEISSFRWSENPNIGDPKIRCLWFSDRNGSTCTRGEMLNLTNRLALVWSLSSAFISSVSSVNWFFLSMLWSNFPW